MHKILISTSLRPICKPSLQHGLPRGNILFLQAPRCTQTVYFSAFNSPQFRHSQPHGKSLIQHIQNWWNSLKGRLKPPREVKKEPSKYRSPRLSITRVAPVGHQNPKTKTQQEPQKPPGAKKKKKKHVFAVPAKQSHHGNEYFYLRLQQILCYFYAGVLGGTIRASPSVKHFIQTTDFNDAFLLLSQAVLPESKYMISDGRGLPASYTKLRQDCLVPKQGCYMNIITTPQMGFGVYIGGAGSLSGSSAAMTRPLRGTLSDEPYAEKKPGIPGGVGRRVLQHLSDRVRRSLKNESSAHYRFMEGNGNRYDFRLLAVFEEEVKVGAVWLLEAFFVLEFGTLRNPKAERNSWTSPTYAGLNRASPLITNGGTSARRKKISP